MVDLCKGRMLEDPRDTFASHSGSPSALSRYTFGQGGGNDNGNSIFPRHKLFPKPLLLRPELHSVLDGTESAKATSALEKNIKSVYPPCLVNPQT